MSELIFASVQLSGVTGGHPGVIDRRSINDDLEDLTANPQNGDVLSWNASTNSWQASSTGAPSLAGLIDTASSFNSNEFLVYDGANWSGSTTAPSLTLSTKLTTNLIEELTSGAGVSIDKVVSRSLVLKDNSITGTVTVTTPTLLTSSYSWVLPTQQGSSDTFLSNDGSGVLAWSGISLEKITDVTTPLNPANGNFLVYNSTSSLWQSTNLSTSLILSNSLSVNTIYEQTSNVGVNIDGVLLKDASVDVSSLKLKDGTTNTITLNAPSTVTSYTTTLPASQGSTNHILKNDGSGQLSYAFLSSILPKRWEFGKRHFKYSIGMSTSSFSLVGNAQLNTSASGNHFISLTTATNSQEGAFFFDFGTSSGLTDWEMRAVIKSGTGADGFHFFCNASTSDILNMTIPDANSGHSVFFNEYAPHNFFLSLFDGNSTLFTKADYSTTLNNNEPQLISFRHIDGVLTVELLPGGYSGTGSGAFLYEANTTSTQNGRYFGIKALTGASNTYHELSYMELRSFGENDISSEN